jgi:hypothetical protein
MNFFFFAGKACMNFNVNIVDRRRESGREALAHTDPGASTRTPRRSEAREEGKRHTPLISLTRSMQSMSAADSFSSSGC